MGNAGSFFKNPIIPKTIAQEIKKYYPKCPQYQEINNQEIKLSAGWLISQCNLQGYQYGGAAVHDTYSIILINKHNAIGKDIINLASIIRNKVMDKFHISLEPEVNFIDKNGKVNVMDIFS